MYLTSVSVAALCDRHSKVLHKVYKHSQFAGKDKVIERPQLLQIILYWRPRQDEPVYRPKTFTRHW